MEADLQSFVAFYLTGKKPADRLEDIGKDKLRPALFAAYRDLTRLRYDFPLVLVDAADIAIVLRDEDVNIDGCLLQALVDGRSEMEMVVQVRDVAHLYHVIDRLRHLPSVMEVLRKTANEE